MANVSVEDVVQAVGGAEPQALLQDLVDTRKDVPDLLASFNQTVDNLALDVKVLRDEQDVVYLVNQDNEEFSFLVHGFVCYALMASNLKEKLRRVNFRLGGMQQRMSLIGGGHSSFQNALLAMKALYSFLSTSTGGVSWKELYMAPFGDVPALNAVTPLFQKRSRDGIEIDVQVPIPEYIDPDGSVQIAADRQNLRFTEENVVLLKGITKANERLTTHDVDPLCIKAGQLVEARVSFRGYKREGEYWFKCKLNSAIIYNSMAVKVLDDLTAAREMHLSNKRHDAYNAHPVKKRKHIKDIASCGDLFDVPFLQKRVAAKKKSSTPQIEHQMDMDVADEDRHGNIQ